MVENLVLSENKTTIKRMWGGNSGPKAYQNLYSTCSTLAVGSTFLAYWRFARSGIQLAPRSLPMHAAALVLRAGGLIAVGQLLPAFDMNKALTTLGMSQLGVEGALCPYGVDLKAGEGHGEVYGIHRVSRRPELFGLMAVGIGGALKATTPTAIAFHGVGPVLCLTGLAMHGDRSQRLNQVGGELSPEKEAQTSVLPFLALFDGRQSWSTLLEEIDPINAKIAIGLAVLMALRPPWLRWVR